MHSDHVALRRRRILSLAPLNKGVGLEIAPLDSPIALKEECDVRYIDVLDTHRLHDHFRGDPNVNLDDVVDIDFALHDGDGRIRSLAEVASPDGPYEWVVASHVIEHVPDLIGWLANIAEVLKDEGHLLLVVPDKRYTFDTQRPLTTVGQILEAHSYRHKTPSERAVFDHFRSIVAVPAADLWAGRPGSDYPRVYTFEDAAHMRQISLETGDYTDSHVWLFTPSVLIDQIVELGRLGLCDFIVEHLIDTAPNELEFSISLLRIPRDLGPAQEEVVRAQGLQTLLEEGDVKTGTNQEVIPEGVLSRTQSAAHHSPQGELPVFSERELNLILLKRRVMRLMKRALRR